MNSSPGLSFHRESHQSSSIGLNGPVGGPVRGPGVAALGRAQHDAGRSAHPDQRLFTGRQRPAAVQQPQIARLGTAVKTPRLKAVMGRGQWPLPKTLRTQRQPARRKFESQLRGLVSGKAQREAASLGIGTGAQVPNPG